MEKEKQNYRQWDLVWQRVAPELNPYPEVRQAAAAARQAEPDIPDCPDAPAEGQTLRDLMQTEQESRRACQACARRAPTPQARRLLGEMARSKEARLRRLMSLYYVTTGQCFRLPVPVGQVEKLPWCQGLRRRYLEEMCLVRQYRQAAAETEDLCLREALCAFAASSRRFAAALLRLLEGNLLA